MRVRRCVDVEDFVARAGDLLARDEARNAMHYAMVEFLRERPDAAARGPYLATVEDDGSVVGAATLLSPNPLLLSPLTPPAGLPAVADDLLDAGRVEQVGDVVGPPEIVEAFCERWAARSGRSWRMRMQERLHRIDAAPDVPAIPGRFRMAGEDDVELMVRWTMEFNREAWGSDLDEDRVRVAAQGKVRGVGGRVGLWEDGEVVSMASYSGRTPSGMRIAPVYTPPARRRHGYGTAVTAAVTRHLFDSGRSCVFLFTDVGNATSNHIYAAIGYRPVCDWVMATVQA